VLSLFAQRLGIRLIAARGKVEIQAHSDNVEIASQRDAHIRSAQGSVLIEADKEIVLRCGRSYYRITPRGITHGTPGDYTERAVSWHRVNPDGTVTRSALPGVNDLPDLSRHGSQFSG
jgi:type VI secretion system secreted protein VgrG